MIEGRYVSLMQFKEYLFSADVEQLSCWRGAEEGYEEELLQCLKFKNQFYIRRINRVGDMCKSFSSKEEANAYFFSITRYGRYKRIVEVA